MILFLLTWSLLKCTHPLIVSLLSLPSQVAALILENTFTSILDMAGVLLPFLKWFIGKGGSKGPKVLNFLVRSPWSTIDVIGEVSLLHASGVSYFEPAVLVWVCLAKSMLAISSHVPQA